MPISQIRSLIPTLTEQLRQVQEGAVSVEHIVPFEPATDMRLLEGVLFLKPEATDLAGGVDVAQALELVNTYIEDWRLQVAGLSIMGAAYLKGHDIIARHYGALNSISRQGERALADAAKQQLQEAFGAELSRGGLVLGAHECMARYPEFTPSILNSIVDNVGSTKLAPGTYCTRWAYGDEVLLLLNAFHPSQLEHFTAPQRAIIVLDVRRAAGEPGDWKTLRTEMLGATKPASANRGSLRRAFLERHAELGIKTISPGFNAVHFSAGPLEGMVETMRYFNDYANQRPLDLSMTAFGRLLLDQGLERPDIEWLMTNPPLSAGGRQVPAFDLTEEIQPIDAAMQLKEGLAQR